MKDVMMTIEPMAMVAGNNVGYNKAMNVMIMALIKLYHVKN